MVSMVGQSPILYVCPIIALFYVMYIQFIIFTEIFLSPDNSPTTSLQGVTLHTVVYTVSLSHNSLQFSMLRVCACAYPVRQPHNILLLQFHFQMY